MMSDMMAPLTNVEELDKRITDMRAVEQWLKLNLNMLQSAIQALEVQRATLATLRAFGAFAQSSMARPGRGCGAESLGVRLAASGSRVGFDPSEFVGRAPSRKPRRARRPQRRRSTPRPGGICCNRNSTRSPSSR